MLDSMLVFTDLFRDTEVVLVKRMAVEGEATNKYRYLGSLLGQVNNRSSIFLDLLLHL